MSRIATQRGRQEEERLESPPTKEVPPEGQDDPPPIKVVDDAPGVPDPKVVPAKPTFVRGGGYDPLD